MRQETFLEQRTASAVVTFQAVGRLLGGFRIATALVALFSAGGCVGPEDQSNNDVAASTSSVQQFVPKCDELCDLRERALRGESASTQEVLRRYKIMSDVEREYWSRIAAENGDPVAQYNYAVELSIQSRSWLDCERAKYWLRRSVHAEHEIAKQAALLIKHIKMVEPKLDKSDSAYCHKAFTMPV